MRSLLLASALLLPLLAAACSDDEEAVENNTAPVPEAETVEIVAKDFSFTPAKFQVDAGGTFEVALNNSGAVPHTFTIDELDVDVEANVGEEMTVSVTPSSAGEFTYYCRFHRAQGMQGRITVTGVGGGTSSPGSPTPDADDGVEGY